jgi:hypothetical protein
MRQIIEDYKLVVVVIRFNLLVQGICAGKLKDAHASVVSISYR